MSKQRTRVFGGRVMAPWLAALCVCAAGVSAEAQTRPFFMGASAIQAFPGPDPLYRNGEAPGSFANAAADSDYVTVFPEYLGIPLQDFAASTRLSPTHPWAVAMQALATKAKAAGKPLVLQLVLSRDRMIAKASNKNGQLVIDRGWVNGCFDFAASANSYVNAAYVNYVAWMVTNFAPAHLVVVVEANLYYQYCGGDTASWRKFVDIERAAYARAKQLAPQMPVYPSFKIEDVYGQSPTGYIASHWAAMANFRRDRLGLASYPFALRRPDQSFISPYELPADYLSRIRDRNPSEPKIVVTETGWNSVSISIGDTNTCYRDFPYSEESYARAYLNQLLYAAYSKGFDGVMWWSDRDLMSATGMSTCYPLSPPPTYSACGGDTWCIGINQIKAEPAGWTPLFAELVFKVFGAMGLRTYDGTARNSLMGLWTTHLSVPRQ